MVPGNNIIKIFNDKKVRMEWSGKTTHEYKNFKELKKENLRDHMTNM